MGVGGPQSISRFLVRDKRRETQTQRTSRMKMKAKMGGGGVQAQGPLEPQKLEKAEIRSSSFHLFDLCLMPTF